MSNSLRDKLLGLGFKAPEPEPVRKPERKPERPANARPADTRSDRRPRPPGKTEAPRRDGRTAPGARPPRADAPARGPRTREEIDLGKAYAIRAQKEKDERIEAERLRQEEARLRREAKAQLAELVKGQGLNDANADIARHFPYGGKIKRIHVTAAQLKQLNAGELGVLQLDGRYTLVTAAFLAQAEQVFAPAVALRVDPNAPAAEDPYADPQYQVPDDLVW